MRGAARPAHRQNVPAGAQPRQKHMGQNRQHDGGPKAGRHAQHGFKGEEIPDRSDDLGRGDLGCIGQQQRIHHRPHDDQHHQRGQKRAQPQITDQQPVGEADQSARRQHRQCRQPHRPAQHAAQGQHHQVGQRENRADRQINPARHDHDGQAKPDQQVFADGPGQATNAARGKHSVDQRAENRDGREQKQKGDGAVDPVFRQDLAHDFVRNQPVAPARQEIACHACLGVSVGKRGGPDVARPCSYNQTLAQPPIWVSSSSVQQDDGVMFSCVICSSGLISANGALPASILACNSILIAAFRSRACPATL